VKFGAKERLTSSFADSSAARLGISTNAKFPLLLRAEVQRPFSHGIFGGLFTATIFDALRFYLYYMCFQREKRGLSGLNSKVITTLVLFFFVAR